MAVASLNELVKDRDMVLLYREYLHDLHSSENLSFWMEVENYKNLPQEELEVVGREIYDKYISKDSPYEINIDSKMRKQVVASVAVGYTQNIFTPIQNAIWKSMELDTFPKFLQSPAYKKLQSGNTTAKTKITRTRSGTLGMVDRYFERQNTHSNNNPSS
ncbi:hypothetical protein PROFUN_02696 [Planoprotostelium fungivorum]|uniref:RGS domain-containing protein n=1 Tax=Planoprotostelium fungivorum TaxID=1890364 RepID=A0A2P6NVG5_9EUKA|nr:hypothetical protein PROFUN_02696 [Planoprotostelium fungivorum]